MTKDTGDLTQFNTVACREYTLPREYSTSQPKGWIQGNTQLDPCWKLQLVSYLHGKHGVEIRIMSLSRDKTHSWVRNSHGSDKFVMDLNNNDTEIPEDQLEEYALQLDEKDFVCQSKAKAKQQRGELAGSSPRIVPMERRNWIGETFSLRVRGFEESDSSSSSLTESTSRRGWSGSFLENLRKIFRIHAHNLFIGLTVDGKHVWQQEEEQKRRFQYCTDDSGIFFLFPSSSRTFRTQSS